MLFKISDFCNKKIPKLGDKNSIYATFLNQKNY